MFFVALSLLAAVVAAGAHATKFTSQCDGTVVCAMLSLDLCAKAGCRVVDNDSCLPQANAHCNKLSEIAWCLAAAGCAVQPERRARQLHTTVGGVTVPSTTQASSVHASESNAHATFAGAAVSSTTQDWTAHTSESTASHDSGSVHVSTTHAVVDTTGASVSREVTIHGAETTTHGGGTAGPHDSGATQAIAMHSTADELLAGGHASTAHVVSSGNAVSSQHQVQHAFDSDENAQKKLHEFEASKQSAGKMATAFTVHALLNVTDAAALAQLVEEIKTALGAHASLRVAIVKNGDKTSITVESENGDGLDDSTASDAASLLARYDAVSTIVATALVENDVSGGAAPTLRVCSATLVAMAILILFATF